jgi:predicted DNA-binding protein
MAKKGVSIRLNPEIEKKVRKLSKDTRRTFSAQVEEMLAQQLGEAKAS